MTKKLQGSEAQLFRTIIDQKGANTVVDLDGSRYIIKPVKNEVQWEIESDPELEKIILQSKKDIKEGNVYSTEEVLNLIDSGEI